METPNPPIHAHMEPYHINRLDVDRIRRDNPSIPIARFLRASRVPGRPYMDEDSDVEMDIVVCSEEAVEKSGFHRNS